MFEVPLLKAFKEEKLQQLKKYLNIVASQVIIDTHLPERRPNTCRCVLMKCCCYQLIKHVNPVMTGTVLSATPSKNP